MLQENEIKEIISKQLKSNNYNDLTSVIMPIHYLFDGYINECKSPLVWVNNSRNF